LALVRVEELNAVASSWVDEVKWVSVDEVGELAFDHKEILAKAIERIRSKVLYKPIGFELLSEKFTLSDLQKLYESILGQQLNRRNFRSKILKLDLLEELERQTNVSHRPAQLYKFNKTKYEELSQKDGKFIFEIRFQQRDSKVEENEKD
jgi:8-oxo-dGTP diphosphatase